MSTFLSRIAVLLVFGCLLVVPAYAGETLATYPSLPSGYTSIKVFDRTGRYAGRILPETRYWVSLDRIPLFLQNALIAVEDARFYEHGGIDVRGVARALVKDVVKRQLAEGGSTITQQLVKNKHLTAEKTIDRKVQEGLLAIEYEKKYSKAQILEMYLNEIYFGNGAWGIAQAARTYFDKNPQDLTDAECATLAGVPKNPGRYNPLGKPADVEQRRKIVLGRMADLGMITREQERKLRGEKLVTVQPGQVPQYLANVRRKLVDWFGPQVIEQGGLQVTAAMDINLQKLAEKVLRQGVQRISPELQGALLCLEPQTGDVLAVAGAVDFAKSNYNRAFFAKRQPGSTIKPLIYAAALEQGVTADSRWDDAPVAYANGNGKSWKPRNYGGETYGELSLRQALAQSNNVVTVKLLDTIGVPSFLEFAGKLGLNLRQPNDLSLALGTDEVTLHDLTLAYTPLATGGLRPAAARTIVRVRDRNGQTWENAPAPIPAIDPAVAFITTRMLGDVLTYGTAKSLNDFAAERPAAGKTGTTDDYRDAWFIGYTPQLITGVWVGHDKPKPGGKGFTGGAVAAPIWENFMRPALADTPPVDFPQPETVVVVAIDPKTGYRANPECTEALEEFFVAGSEPTGYCPAHGSAPAAPADPLPEAPAADADLPAEPAPPNPD